RRHIVLDLALGHELDLQRPFLRALERAGGADLLGLQPVRVDILGLDYYCHSEWWYDGQGSHSPSPHPLGFARLAEQYGSRYGLPMLLTETNLRGLPSDRASWLRYTLEQYEQAVARGVPLRGYCWFPYVDSCDWDPLLARPARRADPVGVVGPGGGSDRVRTSFTAVWEAAAAGAPSAALPAYRFQAPCDVQLRGLLPQMAHWDWQDPPEEDAIPPVRTTTTEGASMPTQSVLVVLSHLRWTWVWQWPQHLVSRFAAGRDEAGARTWFVEEPVAGDVDSPVLEHKQLDGITRVWLVVPRRAGQDDPGSDAARARPYAELLRGLLQDQGRECPDVLLYTPMALDIARALDPGQLYYDVMDNLAAFQDAPGGLRMRQHRLLAGADVVFAGGRSLQREISAHRQDCHLFPSGVETAHYAASRQLRRQRGTTGPKVAGYVGVIDERVDLELLGGLALALPDWIIRVVGPLTKIAPGSLPAAPNLEYPGMVSYPQLPEVMAGFDVGLMPFALNEATRPISPTKTLEYLAAGLPVVSTRVPDVVAGYAGSVRFAGDAGGFAAACRAVVTDSIEERDRGSAVLRAEQDWDRIAADMAALMRTASDAGQGRTDTARTTA
ncbi:glycosyltransferase, partial [Arthrobacter deserti]|nr:glycosyltransferase [Arthrobacter deserti]